MWAIALILAVLVETIFILHNVDPGYFGVSLEFYKVLRVFAVGATLLGGVALFLSLRKKENKKPTWLLAGLMVVCAVPTAHWILRNDHFRSSSLLERGNVKVHELISYLKDYPKTPPAQAVKWLYKYKGPTKRYPAFLAHQATYFVMGLDDGFSRYRKPAMEGAYSRLGRLKEKQRLRGYLKMIQLATGFIVRHNPRRLKVLAMAGSWALEHLRKELQGGRMSRWPYGSQNLAKARYADEKPLSPAPTLLTLYEPGGGSEDVGTKSLSQEVLESGLLDWVAAHGLDLQEKVKDPKYKLRITRKTKTVKKDFRLKSRVFKKMPVPLFTLQLELRRVGDSNPLYTKTTTTSKSIFGFIITSKKGRAGLLREIRQRSMRNAAKSIVADFKTPGLILRSPRKSGQKDKRKRAKKRR